MLWRLIEKIYEEPWVLFLPEYMAVHCCHVNPVVAQPQTLCWRSLERKSSGPHPQIHPGGAAGAAGTLIWSVFNSLTLGAGVGHPSLCVTQQTLWRPGSPPLGSVYQRAETSVKWRWRTRLCQRLQSQCLVLMWTLCEKGSASRGTL